MPIRTNQPSSNSGPSGRARPPLLLLPLHRLPADVAPAEAVGPFDAVDRRIGAGLRFGDGLAGRADIQQASAIGENVAVLGDRAGMEDFDAFDLAASSSQVARMSAATCENHNRTPDIASLKASIESEFS